MSYRRSLVAAALLLQVRALGAQTDTSQPAGADTTVRAVAELIRGADLAQHLDAIASASAGGRETPSPGLERTAQYVATQFRALRLAPAGQPVGPVPDGAQRAASAAPVATTAFVDVGVIPMDAERVLERQTVLVEAGRIRAIGPVRDVPVPRGGVESTGAAST